MHGQMVARVALNQILRLLFRGMDRVALEPASRGDVFLNRSYRRPRTHCRSCSRRSTILAPIFLAQSFQVAYSSPFTCSKTIGADHACFCNKTISAGLRAFLHQFAMGLFGRTVLSRQKMFAHPYQDDRRLEFPWLYDEHLCVRYKRAIGMISSKG